MAHTQKNTTGFCDWHCVDYFSCRDDSSEKHDCHSGAISNDLSVLRHYVYVWFFVGVLAIGCVLIMLMKGPGYVADAYELPKEDKKLEPKSTNHP